MVCSTALGAAPGSIGNSALQNASLSITPGTGLSGGGAVALGGSVTLNNSGVTSLSSGGGATVSASNGAVTLGTVAGGDLSGSLSSATVAGLQGVSVAPVSPGDQQVLKYSAASGQWTPGSDNSNGGSVTSVGSGAGLTGGPITGSGTLSIAAGGVTNAMLENASVTVSPGAGLSGGGAVALGGAVTLNNTGVTSLTGGGGATVSASNGAVTLGTSAGGDLSGSLNNATVARLRGVTVSAAVPADQQVLKYSAASSQWVPGPDNSNSGSVTSVGSGAGLTGGPITNSGSLSIATGGVTNAMLQNQAVNVNAGAGLSGGGAVALGGSVTLNNAGVTSLTGGGGATVSASNGAVTLGTSAGGDLSGSLSGATVTRVNGVPVSATAAGAVFGGPTSNADAWHTHAGIGCTAYIVTTTVGSTTNCSSYPGPFSPAGWTVSSSWNYQQPSSVCWTQTLCSK
jgi:hypothetical protein